MTRQGNLKEKGACVGRMMRTAVEDGTSVRLTSEFFGLSLSLFLTSLLVRPSAFEKQQWQQISGLVLTSKHPSISLAHF